MTCLAKGALVVSVGIAIAGSVIRCTLASGSATAPQAAPKAEPTPASSVRPNVLLIVIDTLRRDRLGCYGYGGGTSPRLDRFAADALLFERCLAPSGWTEPSTASLLTGLYPTRHGCHEYAVLPAELELVSERLQSVGYRTIGVSGNPNASPQFGFDQGFDAFWFDQNDKAREYPDVSELVAHAEALLAQDDDRPTFLYLHLMNVHGPYLTPGAWRDRFRRPGARDFPFQNEVWKDVMRKGMVERRAEVTPADIADLEARYDAAVAYTDDVVGRFLERRRATAAGRDELVVVTSDHGEELFDHGGFGHGFTLQAEIVDVPLLIRPPAGGAGRRIDTPVSLVDLPATLLEHLGALPPEAQGRLGDGMSLWPLVDGREFERDLPLVSHLERGKQGSAFLLQSWPLRLIETGHDYSGRSGVAELFDQATDAAERVDLLVRDPERSAQLRALLAARRAALEAQGLAAQRVPLSDDQRRQMAALGYGDG